MTIKQHMHNFLLPQSNILLIQNQEININTKAQQFASMEMKGKIMIIYQERIIFKLLVPTKVHFIM
jgi:hypothetical protein